MLRFCLNFYWFLFLLMINHTHTIDAVRNDLSKHLLINWLDFVMHFSVSMEWLNYLQVRIDDFEWQYYFSNSTGENKRSLYQFEMGGKELYKWHIHIHHHANNDSSTQLKHLNVQMNNCPSERDRNREKPEYPLMNNSLKLNCWAVFSGYLITKTRANGLNHQSK